MSYDTPYRIEIDKRNYTTVFDILRTGEGKIATVYRLSDARRIVDALNKQELERAIARVA